MLYRGRNNVYDIAIVDKLTKIEYYGEKIVSILVKLLDRILTYSKAIDQI